MATTALPDFNVTTSYTDIVAVTPAAGSVDIEIQNIGTNPVSIVPRASGGAPANTTGLILKPGEGYKFNAAQIWAKSFGGPGKLGLVTT